MAEDCSLVTDEDVGVILRTALDDVEKIGGGVKIDHILADVIFEPSLKKTSLKYTLLHRN